MSTEMIERVAAVLEGTDWSVLTPYDLNTMDDVPMTSIVRTVLAAMRDPTINMRKAGEAEMMARHPNLDCFRDPYVDSTWQAMIDAALGDAS